MGDWDPQYIQPNPLAIAQPDAWAPLGQQPKDAGLADAWDVNGPAIAQNMRDTMAAVRDPQTWTDAAREYGQALVAGTGVEGGGIRAFHGSPHSFDKFDIGKIGTGEGAQAYGHGLYFAENEGVAQSYRDMLGTRSMDLKDPGNLAAWMYHKNMGDRANAITELKTSLKSAQNYPKSYQPGDVDRFSAALDKLESNAEMPSAPGHMYEVNLNANPDHFLDWDKPLSEQHPVVRDAINNIADKSSSLTQRMMESERNKIPLTGQDVVSALSRNADRGAPEITQRLQAAGIPGIRYLDAGSRGAGEGTSNHVVFDPAMIEIIKKYGLAGLMAGGGAAAMAQPAQSDGWEPVAQEPK